MFREPVGKQYFAMLSITPAEVWQNIKPFFVLFEVIKLYYEVDKIGIHHVTNKVTSHSLSNSTIVLI